MARLCRPNQLFRLFSVLYVIGGVGIFVFGFMKQTESNYDAPKVPPGWVMGMMWICIGSIIAATWLALQCAQMCACKKRTRLQLGMQGITIFSAAAICIFGLFITYRHPYKWTPCVCAENEWGPSCAPCTCVNGVCDDGLLGSGRCACDLGWDGPNCSICADRWRPAGECFLCKRGFTGDTCNECATGYTGENCDVCDHGWEPWTHTSDMFPDAIDEDNRHICDECRPNYWGRECKPCPFSNDVPRVTLLKNQPLVQGTRVRDAEGRIGHITAMQIREQNFWKTSFSYDPDTLTDTRIRIRYDLDNTESQWTTLDYISGVQCGNRGTCQDDLAHQQNNPNWRDTCTAATKTTCTTHDDCASENCKGICIGTELPVPFLFTIRLESKLCETNADCVDPTIEIEPNVTYTGGQCVDRFCCDESYHGDGQCACDVANAQPPACDFCPGYDWIHEEPDTICGGGQKGTCNPSYDFNDDYIQMRCSCGSEVVDVGGVVDAQRSILWSGDVCQCGRYSMDGDAPDSATCEVCGSGYWGPECRECPGGGSIFACGGHGVCSDGPTGTGECDCDTDYNNPLGSAWQLAPYQKRWPSETAYENAAGSSDVCIECAPNFWGAECKRCYDMDIIKSSEIDDLRQDGNRSLCLKGVCSLACGGGGWCQWGRTGDGTCKCWSNVEDASSWNPLDNVCVYGESPDLCPSLGYCKEGQNHRKDFTPCDSDQSCTCVPWQQIDWRPANNLLTCIKD